MTNWHFLFLGDEMMANQPANEIREAFAPLFNAAGNPTDMAIFTRSQSGSLHCEVSVYFSPSSAAVAKIVDAQPCDRPLKAGLNLLAGNKNCWSVLFPES